MPKKKVVKKSVNRPVYKRKSCNSNNCAPGGCAYFLGMIGAAIYFVSATSGFWPTVLAFLKAIIWPLFLVFEAFKFFLG